jgi:hypothetical protein
MMGGDGRSAIPARLLNPFVRAVAVQDCPALTASKARARCT